MSNDGKDIVVGAASGFFWLHRGLPYLVTNWHVISGRDPFTGEVISRNGYIPSKITFRGVELVIKDGLIDFHRKVYRLTLPDDAQSIFSKPPQIKGVGVDIWMIPIPEGVSVQKLPERRGFQGAENFSCFVNENIGRPIVTGAGDDCFILGYPLQNYDGLAPPIWKRGSIASEPHIGVGNLPMFLVDANTKDGMSGSPIIRKATLFAADNKDIGAIQEFPAYDMIGVYAGRLQSSDLTQVGVGYGWYKSLIDEVGDYYTYSRLPDLT